MMMTHLFCAMFRKYILIENIFCTHDLMVEFIVIVIVRAKSKQLKIDKLLTRNQHSWCMMLLLLLCENFVQILPTFENLHTAHT